MNHCLFHALFVWLLWLIAAAGPRIAFLSNEYFLLEHSTHFQIGISALVSMCLFGNRYPWSDRILRNTTLSMFDWSDNSKHTAMAFKFIHIFHCYNLHYGLCECRWQYNIREYSLQRSSMCLLSILFEPTSWLHGIVNADFGFDCIRTRKRNHIDRTIFNYHLHILINGLHLLLRLVGC